MTVDGEAWRTRSPTSGLAAVALGAIVVAAPLDGALAQDIDPDIKWSFGGQYGREELRENLRDEAYWGELAAALALGGVLVSDSSFYAPYSFDRFPPAVDPFEGLMVVGESVRMRAAPDTSAPVLDSRSWEVVVRDREAERSAGLPWDGPWTAVRLPDGRTGYVASRYLRSPIDYRAGFAYRGGRWWMVVFIAGD